MIDIPLSFKVHNVMIITTKGTTEIESTQYSMWELNPTT